MSNKQRVTVEGYFHKPQADFFEGLDFLQNEGAKLELSEQHAHLYYKGFLDPEATGKLLAWHETIENKAVSGKLVILVDYEPPYVVDWHHVEKGDHWREALNAGLESDSEGLRIFVSRLEHLLHMG